MNPRIKQVLNPPNIISLVRILIAPILIYLAVSQQPNGFIALLLFAEFTDVLDGYLARKLKMITEIGSHLDSWGDFIIYSTIAVCAWILWPDILLSEINYFIIIVLSFTLPALFGLMKFKKFTSYHTWSVKLAVLVTVIAYVLLFTGIASWPIKVAALFCVYAALEEIGITLLLKEEHADVRTLWKAIKQKKR